MMVRPVGLLEMTDQNGSDSKILGVAGDNPRFDQIQSIDQVFVHNKCEIEHFFAIYKEFEGRQTKISGWRGAQKAHRLIRGARERFATAHTPPKRTKAE